MSTVVGQEKSPVIRSEEDLAHYFQKFAKPRNNMRVGIEAEFFGVHSKTGKALPYFGPEGIEEVLKALARNFHYEPVLEDGKVIALYRGNTMIALEPGGQIELSAPPVFNVFQIEKQIQNFLEELREVSTEFPSIAWIAAGLQPFSSLEEISWVPKKRYTIMAEHLKTHGTLSHEMMKRTAANQINVDYTSEENAMANLRTVLGITSIVTAIFANSSFSEGWPNGFLSYRLEIWNHTDPDRSGLISQFTRPGQTFRNYLEYLLKIPILFIVRNHQWIPLKNLTFGDFVRKGYEDFKATLTDFELHLSSVFPEARLKQYLEIRGVDCQKPDLIPTVAAFWKGILYDPETSEKAWKLVSFAKEEERVRLHLEVPKKGLNAKLAGKPILPIARELVDLSCSSLAKQKTRDEKRDECVFLNRIREEITNPGKSPAEILLEKWSSEFKQQPSKLIEYLRI